MRRVRCNIDGESRDVRMWDSAYVLLPRVAEVPSVDSSPGSRFAPVAIRRPPRVRVKEFIRDARTQMSNMWDSGWHRLDDPSLGGVAIPGEDNDLYKVARG